MNTERLLRMRLAHACCGIAAQAQEIPSINLRPVPEPAAHVCCYRRCAGDGSRPEVVLSGQLAPLNRLTATQLFIDAQLPFLY